MRTLQAWESIPTPRCLGGPRAQAGARTRPLQAEDKQPSPLTRLLPCPSLPESGEFPATGREVKQLDGEVEESDVLESEQGLPERARDPIEYRKEDTPQDENRGSP